MCPLNKKADTNLKIINRQVVPGCTETPVRDLLLVGTPPNEITLFSYYTT